MILSPESSIGVFDSGLGGLTVLRELQRHVAERRYIYLGDNARYPYGTKGTETIVRYAQECAQFLLAQGIGALVVACNTASAAALDILSRECSVPVVGTIQPAVRVALRVTENNRVGVLGTNSTCASGVYESALKAGKADLKISSQACPLFVPMVESGMLDGEIVDKVVELYLAEMRRAEVDTVILGCTHYPLLAPAIQKFLGEHVKVVECGREIAREIRALVGPASVNLEPRSDEYYVTDEVGRFNYLATHVLGDQQVVATKVDSLTAPSAARRMVNSIT